MNKLIGSNQFKSKYGLINKVYKYGIGLGVGFILLILILSTIKLTNYLDTYEVRFENPIQIQPREVVVNHLVKQAEASVDPKEVRVHEVFGVNADTFLKIAYAESGQNSGSKGWNCHYNGKSAACKTEDRDNAWSVDCGFLQVNVQGKICPPEMYELEYNLQAAKGKFERQGYGAWTVCKIKKVIC